MPNLVLFRRQFEGVARHTGLVWAASGRISGSSGVPRLDAAMVQSFDDPTLGKIDHPESNNVAGSPPGAGPKLARLLCWGRPNYRHQGQ